MINSIRIFKGFKDSGQSQIRVKESYLDELEINKNVLISNKIKDDYIYIDEKNFSILKNILIEKGIGSKIIWEIEKIIF
jgi:hypothetical protein